MATSIIADRVTVTLKQAAALILANPGNRFFLQGEPGIGKSSIIKMLAASTGYATAYIDCPNMDLGDIAMPVIDHETRTTRYYPNGRFQLHHGKPVIIMLDEFTKAADPVKNMLHPLLEVHNPRLGDVSLPPGSIVFLTGNLESDGVGDSLLAHTKMRITRVEVGKPAADEWLEWAVGNDVDPIVMAWVKRTPHCLASYREGNQKGNEFIYMPNTVQESVVTPRTLELVSNIIKMRHAFDPDALRAAMIGTVGASAASSIAAFIQHHESLPSWEEITTNPLGARIPANDGAMHVLVFGAVQRVRTPQEMDAMMEYTGRCHVEWQSIFNLQMAKNHANQALLFRCAKFAKWITKNQDLL